MSRARDNADLGDSYGSLAVGVTGGSGLNAVSPANLASGVMPVGVTGGSGLNALNASNLSTGTILDARMPDLTGEVTTSAGAVATTVTDNIVDEANLKISNAGSNGQFLSKQSGDTGGLTWATLSGYSAPTIGSTSIASGSTNATIAGLTLTSPVLNTGVSGTAILDEDAMGSNSATKLATQQSIKAYVDASSSIPTSITVADESSDTTCFPLFVTAATGNLAPKSGSNLIFNSSTGLLKAAQFSTTDLILNNINSMANEVDGTRGHWTIQEGENDLFIMNRVTNKKYKFTLEEIK